MFLEVFIVSSFVTILSSASVASRDGIFVRDGRIVGGFNAGPSQFPYQVSLRTPLLQHFCGASIVSSSWVLTAAHCTSGHPQNGVLVVVGTNFLNTGGQSYITSRIVSHPSYHAVTLANDVSMVQTAATITFGSAVQAIPLGIPEIGANTACVVTGWGATTVDGGPTSIHLQGLNTRTISNADCRARHSSGSVLMVFDNKICTFTQAGQGICQGDSGGPLVSNGALIGIASWSIPCARGLPDGFDRISHHRTWILNTIS